MHNEQKQHHRRKQNVRSKPEFERLMQIAQSIYPAQRCRAFNRVHQTIVIDAVQFGCCRCKFFTGAGEHRV